MNGDFHTQIQIVSQTEICSLCFIFQVESHSTCAYDYLKIYDGPDDSALLLDKLCGTTLPTGNIYSTGNVMMIHFHTDLSKADTGFSIQFAKGTYHCKHNGVDKFPEFRCLKGVTLT